MARPWRDELRRIPTASQRRHRRRRRGADLRRGRRRRDRRHVVGLAHRVRADGAGPRAAQHPRPRGSPPPAVRAASGSTTRSGDGCSATRRSSRSPPTAGRTSPTIATRWAPHEPDLALYAGYPVARASWHRKLRRDATGSRARQEPAVAPGAAPQAARPRPCTSSLSRRSCSGRPSPCDRPLAYVVWLGSWCTLWKVSNRLRAIAEHGGMERSADRRRTTHVIRQSRLGPLLHGPLQHRLAPGPPRRHGSAVDATCPASTTSWWRPGGSRPSSSTPAIGRSGGPAAPALLTAAPATLIHPSPTVTPTDTPTTSHSAVPEVGHVRSSARSAQLVLVAGTVSGPARVRTLPSGDELRRVRRHHAGPTGTRALPVTWFSPGADRHALDAGLGRVRSPASVRRRFFRAGADPESHRDRRRPGGRRHRASRPAVKRLLADVARSLADAAPT